MNRRDFLKIAGLAPIVLATARLVFGNELANPRRILVLVELAGGNDGLNTIVPHANSTYYARRPGLAVGRDEVIRINDQIGFNPNLAPLNDVWGAEELAIVQGVGYPSPNRSHFRSIDIWETASGSHDTLTQGWINEALKGEQLDLAAEGIVLGAPDVGPLTGADVRTLVMDSIEQFVADARRVREVPSSPDSNALGHVLGVQSDLIAANNRLEAQISAAPDLTATFPRGAFAQQLKSAATLISAGAEVAVIKVTHAGFDTHANQRRQHDNLLTQFAEGLTAFRDEMIAIGRWNDVLVMTYSEFGRRVAENGSNGTDHGTAAPHFVLGGSVNGGLYGSAPDLDSLTDGDLLHTVDYRQLYATICERWWGVSRSFLGEFETGGLAFV